MKADISRPDPIALTLLPYCPYVTPQQQATVLQNANAAGLSWGGNFANPDPVHFYSKVPGGLTNRSKYIEAAQQAAKHGGAQCGCQQP